MPRLLAVSLNTMSRLLADDTALLIHESSLSKIGELASLANSEILSISKWMIANRLTLHPKKPLLQMYLLYVLFRLLPTLLLLLKMLR